MLRRIAFVFALQSLAGASFISGPTVKLDAATVTGTNVGQISKFLGIPYALPPARFRPAQASNPYRGSLDAREYGALCPQQKIILPDSGIREVDTILNTTPELRNAPGVESEDCLTINVIKPAASLIHSSHPLPVMISYVFEGAYQAGDTAGYDEIGSDLVKRSIALGKPIIYVSMNYRSHTSIAYGFMGGVEIFEDGSGNLGLRDQRLALKWVNKYIRSFSGDESKVTLWGQSSGAISIALQMMTNGGNNEGLFRAGFMQSGAPLPIGNITKGTGQVYYDFISADTGCSASNNTLECLRALPFPVLKASVDKTPSFFSYLSLALIWHPSVDGVFLQDNPQSLVTQGKFASVPIVSGTTDDEGTMFGLSSLNVTTEDQFRQYISTVWYPRNPVSELDQLWTFYPADVTAGSPFDTGNKNALTPQFKRISAFIGDSVQDGPRRTFLQKASTNTKVWAYLSKVAKSTKGVGSYHGSDLVSGVANDYLINFVSDLDPNTGSGPRWPNYNTQSPQLLTFPPSGKPVLTPDTFRLDAINYLNNLSFAHPFVL
ncbi:hypothetical protein CVT25_002635 [Psilocybe cyanescens]|uniref:Carboxylesterase type B domain-containing protein n=1 Tax=Psilocybe cyanescens TaxID=93625 RepID=A0A409WLG4_PSICY|nr:hypothetical protein CVT25_002635 [Psilocybe cyanescens]